MEAPNFFHIKVTTDTWQKIACHAKYADLLLAVEPYSLIKKGDILVFDDEGNPYPKCICRVTGSRWFKGFKSAFGSSSPASYGYIMGEGQRASYRDFEDNYAVNDIKTHGVIGLSWQLMSCEYVKYTKATAYGRIKPKEAKDYEVEPELADCEEPEDGGSVVTPPGSLDGIISEMERLTKAYRSMAAGAAAVPGPASEVSVEQEPVITEEPEDTEDREETLTAVPQADEQFEDQVRECLRQMDCAEQEPSQEQGDA